MHYFQNSGMKDSIEELSFFHLHGLKYLGINYLYLHKNAKPNEALISIL